MPQVLENDYFPLLRKFENDKEIKKIILTTTTTSSANIFKKLRLKKTIHKFFPIDSNYFSKNLSNIGSKVELYLSSFKYGL